MTKKRTLQILRGTTVQNDAYTGFAGELTMDTTTNELRLHDGSTTGGHIIGSGSGGGGYHPDLFTWQWADHELNDVQWLRADTFSWQSGAVYQAAYQHLVDDIDGKTLQSETVAGTTVQFYLADDGHKICPASQESNVAAIYTATGVAWYYILDTVNQRFKLPRTQFGVTGLRDIVGKYVEAGLPDHNHTVGIPINSGWNGTARIGASDLNTVQATKSFTSDNASASNSIYGNSTTVQPPATEMYLYFYVGNFTQTALENTAGITAETLNDKVDKGHQVIEFQAPTADNGYTWYRKYADGWVEQGGQYVGVVGVSTGVSITLPVTMTDANYTLNITGEQNSNNWVGAVIRNGTRTTTGFQAYIWGGGSGDQIRGLCWTVQGMAA